MGWHGYRVTGSSQSGLSVWSLHVLPMLARVSSGCSKLSVGMNEIVNVCLCVCPVLDWPPVQGVSLPVARDDGKGSSTHNKRLEKLMNG